MASTKEISNNEKSHQAWHRQQAAAKKEREQQLTANYALKQLWAQPENMVDLKKKVIALSCDIDIITQRKEVLEADIKPEGKNAEDRKDFKTKALADSVDYQVILDTLGELKLKRDMAMADMELATMLWKSARTQVEYLGTIIANV